MLHCADTHIFLSEHGAASGVHHVLGQGVDHRFVFQVYALELDAVVFRSRFEGGRYLQAGVQAAPFDCERCIECKLVHIVVLCCLSVWKFVLR